MSSSLALRRSRMHKGIEVLRRGDRWGLRWARVKGGGEALRLEGECQGGGHRGRGDRAGGRHRVEWAAIRCVMQVECRSGLKTKWVGGWWILCKQASVCTDCMSRDLSMHRSIGGRRNIQPWRWVNVEVGARQDRGKGGPRRGWMLRGQALRRLCMY